MALVNDWIDKAEMDFKGAVALNRQRKEPLPDLVCYHCQQSTEKYLKAYLISMEMTPPHIHDLIQLLNLCTLHDSTLGEYQSAVQLLNPYGVLIRYPGMSATVAEAKEAMQAMRRLRAILRSKLGC